MTTDKKETELRKERRERYLSSLIKEAVVNVLAEQDLEQQPQMSSAPPQSRPSPQTNTMDTDVQQPPEPQQQQQEEEEFTVEAMVDKLNILRGSRSFTDPEVFGRLTTFFNNLTDEQKNSVDWLLTELGRVAIDASEEQVDPNAQQQQQQQQQSASQQPPPSQGAPQPSAPQAAAPVTPTGGTGI